MQKLFIPYKSNATTLWNFRYTFINYIYLSVTTLFKDYSSTSIMLVCIYGLWQKIIGIQVIPITSAFSLKPLSREIEMFIEILITQSKTTIKREQALAPSCIYSEGALGDEPGSAF